jgi:hypothetical protein
MQCSTVRRENDRELRGSSRPSRKNMETRIATSFWQCKVCLPASSSPIATLRLCLNCHTCVQVGRQMATHPDVLTIADHYKVFKRTNSSLRSYLSFRSCRALSFGIRQTRRKRATRVGMERSLSGDHLLLYSRSNPSARNRYYWKS